MTSLPNLPRPRWGQRRYVRHRALARAAALAVLVVLMLWPAGASASFQLGLEDPGFGDPAGSPTSQIAYNALNAVRGSTVRLYVPWNAIAPNGSTEPSGFDPTDPSDPRYRWSTLDAALRNLTAKHVRVVLDLAEPAPAWAIPPGEPASDRAFGGSWNPNARKFGLFAQAVARRYSGQFADPLNSGRALPRVGLWEIWNEENLPLGLLAPDLVSEYRAMLNAAYGSIKSVSSSNVVAIGGLAPVSYESVSISPLKFAAQLLCLRRVGTHFVRAAGCPGKVRFDVLAMHPYSLLATPTKHAYHYDDVLVADMGKLDTLLNAAKRLHTAGSGSHYGLWVTEFSWFTNPPNKFVGERDRVAARYTAYAMYEMWRAGVSLVTWYTARDASNYNVNAPNTYGLSLYYASGRPKLMMQGFRFPVIARVRAGRGYIWGRAPVSSRVKVIGQHRVGRTWKAIKTVRTGSDGVFQLRFAAHGNGIYRAVIPGRAVSLGYNSKPIPAARTHNS